MKHQLTDSDAQACENMAGWRCRHTVLNRLVSTADDQTALKCLFINLKMQFTELGALPLDNLRLQPLLK